MKKSIGFQGRLTGWIQVSMGELVGGARRRWSGLGLLVLGVGALLNLWVTPALGSFSDSGESFTGVYFSSVAWGDVDNDGDLDLLLTGTAASPVTTLYLNNGDGTFSPHPSQSFPGVSDGSVAWGDADNDGYLDLFLTEPTGATLYLNDGTGSFSADTSQSFPDVASSSVAWGDADNDGDLDLFLTGDTGDGYVAMLYLNDAGSFEASSQVFTGVYFSSVAWGDADNDGDLDLFLTGYTGTSPVAKLYLNSGTGSFEASSQSFTGVEWSSVAWGDVDNDGDLDLLLTGFGTGYVATLYRNKGAGSFEATSQPFPGVFRSSVAWGDADNDGDLDLFLTGDTGDGYVATLYLNNGAGSFSVSSESFPGVYAGSVAWGDMDNDGDLDLLLTGSIGGSQVAKLYQNDASDSNSAPTAPTTLNATTSGTDATLSWRAATDTKTLADGLNYKLRVGTSSGADNILPAMASSDGWRKIAAIGPVQKNGAAYTWTLHGLVPGQTYYWSVQAVDTALAGSPWATEAQFFVNQAPTNLSLSNSSVAESQPIGTVVGTFTTTDPNAGDTFTYSLVSGTGSADNGSFTISGNTLKTAAIFDYETKNSYSIRVQTRDAGGLTFQKVFTITVTDVAENTYLLWTK
ncbi:fibronectin type III domain protein [Candidatus Vecturithrix granuli]|uniref:Fibronectin type III domain protein n=1 Tax=Vecturithrix granuli TaxID=1499967 RepID=A0A0S6W7J4_VECG1|nr:fibronectin type III domain protein [Candidatus Vecturithrix granuli]